MMSVCLIVHPHFPPPLPITLSWLIPTKSCRKQKSQRQLNSYNYFCCRSSIQQAGEVRHWEERDSQALPLIALLGGGWQRVPPLHPEDLRHLAQVPGQHGRMGSKTGLLKDTRAKMVQRLINSEGRQSTNPTLCSLGFVVRRALAEFAIQNPGGVFVSGCLKHDFLMLLGCFCSSVQCWVPLPQGALNLSGFFWNLWQSSCALSPSCCSHLASAMNANWELPSFLVTVRLLPMYTKCKSLPVLMKKFSLCHQFRHLMSGRPCFQ